MVYHPEIDILKANFDLSEEDRDVEIREKVQAGLKILGADDASTFRYLLELLSVKESLPDEIQVSSDERKNQIIRALNQIVIKGSERRPLVLVYEDLHWTDTSSEEALKSLLINIAGKSVLLLFTYRPEFVHTWGGKSYHSQLNLNRLSNREGLPMAHHLLAAKHIESRLEEFVLQKTEGNPFFIEEFIKSLKDLKIIEKQEDTYCIAEDIQTVAIPSSIQDVIMARLDTLPEEAKDILQIGSVIGREFNYDLIWRVTNLSEEKLFSHLSILKDL